MTRAGEAGQAGGPGRRRLAGCRGDRARLVADSAGGNGCRDEVGPVGGRGGQVGGGGLRTTAHREPGGRVLARRRARRGTAARKCLRIPVRPGPPLGRGLRGGRQRLVRCQFRPVVHIGELLPLAAVPLRAVPRPSAACLASADRCLALLWATLRAAITPAALLGARPLRAAALAIAPTGAGVVPVPVLHAPVVAAGPLPVTALVKAAARARSGQPAHAARPRRRPAPPATAPVASAAVVLAAGPAGELLGVLGSHAPRGNNDEDENDDDNHCQDDHELSHRTIQHGMASQGGASEAHAAIDADLFRCASTLSRIRGLTLGQ